MTDKPKRGRELSIFKVRRTLLTQSGDLWIGGVFFRRLNERFVTNVCKSAIKPCWLHVAIVPLIQVANQIFRCLAEDAHDRFAGEAGFCGHGALL